MGEIINVHQLARLLGTWDGGAGSLGDRLASAVKSLVVDGRLPAGSRLPSERQFSQALGVARTTVGHAFDLLREDGTLSSRSGVGTFVSSVGSASLARGEARLQSYLESTSHRIDLRSAALFGVPLVNDEMSNLVAGGSMLETNGYVIDGLPTLREAVATYYCDDGLPTSPNQVLITNGAQQAMHLIARSFVEAGDAVLVEEPTYRGGIETFRAVGARLYSVPSGAAGIDPDAAADAMRRHRPRFLLMMSTVHNPSGSCLDARRRRALGAAADQYGVTIIDDASTRDTLLSETAPLPMGSYASQTLLVGSASKSFWGGLRIGWIRADRSLLASLVAGKGAEDLGTSLPSQILTARLFGRIEEARAFRRKQLGDGLRNLLTQISTLLPEWVPYMPSGGASLWIRLPPGASASALAEQARRVGVDILPGPTFSATNDLDDHVRIAFSAPPALVAEGMRRLADVWQSGRQQATNRKLVFDPDRVAAETPPNNSR